MNWAELLKIAYSKAAESTNPSTQNAALLVNDNGQVLACVENPFPRGIAETPERLVKPLRYKMSVHAERNLIYTAAREGIKTEGLTMVAPWASCADCAQAVIQAGIKRLVTHQQALDHSNGWVEEVALGLSMMREAGVEVIIYDGLIGATSIRRDYEVWQP
ncbi:MAG: CMP deaminase [Candidatus Vogelbacteria bacterium]|nr:CMP deaminase [Candidatus Vogelbacteria bacterium]